MSNFAALALIVATISITVCLAVLSMDKAKGQAVEIISGAFYGMPMSFEFRRIVAYQAFIWTVLNMAFLNLFNAVVMWGVAGSVADSSIRWMAHAALLFHGVAAVSWLGSTFIGVLYILGQLRKAEGPQ